MSFYCYFHDSYIVNLVKEKRPATSDMSQVENKLPFSFDEEPNDWQYG